MNPKNIMYKNANDYPPGSKLYYVKNANNYPPGSKLYYVNDMQLMAKEIEKLKLEVAKLNLRIEAMQIPNCKYLGR